MSEPKSLLQVAKLASGSDHGLCLVRKMSGQGATLRVRFPVKEGDFLQFSLKDGREFSGTVSIAEGDRVELLFDGAGAAASDYPRNVALTERESVRFPVRAPLVLVLGRASYPLFSLNISLHGLAVETAGMVLLDRGRHVVLHIPGLAPRDGEVIWGNAGKAGIRFLLPLGFSELDDWLRRQP